MINIKSKIPIYIVALILIILIIIVAIFLSSKEPKPETVASNKLVSTSASLLQAKEDKIYYADEGKLSLYSYDLNSKEENNVFSLEAPIDIYSISPDQNSFFVQTNKDGVFKNWVYNKETSSLNDARECIVSLIYSGNGVIYNCFSQLYDYDPKYTNTINFAKNPNSEGEASANLNIDPPKKILGEVDDNVYLLSDSSGYDSNNVLSYNKKTGKVDKVTDEGSVNKAILSIETKLLVYSTENSPNEFFIMDLASGDVKKMEFETDLDLSALSREGKILVLPYGKEGNFIYKLDLSTLQGEAFNPGSTSSITSLSAIGNDIFFSTIEGVFVFRPD